MINIHEEVKHNVRSYRIYPRLEGLVVTLIIFLSICITTYLLYLHAIQAQKGEIREGLLRATRILANQVDPELHKTFTRKEQEQSPAYQKAIKPFVQLLEQDKAIRFASTSILKDGKVYFIYDGTPEGDWDHDGVEDSVAIMEEYPDPNEEIKRALYERIPTVSESPYKDKWGWFFSAYMPFYDKNGQFVGVVGLIQDASHYFERLRPIEYAAAESLITGAIVAVLCGFAVWFVRRFSHDINESRLAIMEDLKQAVTIAQQASKKKSEFLANMSHEIRTPMNAVLGFTKSLLSGPVSPTQKEQLEIIKESGDALMGIINEILDLSKIEAGKVELRHEDMDLYKTVENVVQLLSAETRRKGIELAVYIDPEVPVLVNADQGRIRQVLVNLLGNAIKFTTKGGVLLHITRGGTTEVEKELLLFQVKDTGIGIDKEGIDKIFEEFSQANSQIEGQFGGTGLGLTITQKLIHLMGGNIRVESEVGKGSCFYFSLLLDQASTCPLPLASKKPAVHSALIITDNKILEESLSLQLHSLQIKPEIRTEICLLKEYLPQKVECVLIDADTVRLPKDAVEQIHKLTGKMPYVIMLYHNTAMPEGSLPDYIHQALAKPVRLKKLHSILTEPAHFENISEPVSLKKR